MNNLSLKNGDINFMAYSVDATWGINVGEKGGFIAMFSRALTSAEITNLSKWELERFGAY